ncbi:energy transducer TonB [Antarcticibacterium arcticum]|uniref:Energy transducer TonB n=1 Tax=Antarcticibacterium arcticum TaxID=2585771 RepID=A0A5B8YJ31_9FLAO|nr:energy transducer TonB [Antarcticibacterium arcticum]QED37952.1 energy transducer TonB [Antarcticibacterium arcticum]
MKYFLLFSIITLFSFNTYSQEGVSVKGNSISTKEIAPIWPGCEKSGEPSKDCFNKKLNEHVKANFKYPKDSKGAFIRGKSVLSFSIDETGKVKDITAEGPHKAINEEAIRITKLFPAMKPGMRAGKPATINYKMPFNF